MRGLGFTNAKTFAAMTHQFNSEWVTRSDDFRRIELVEISRFENDKID